jgi:pyrroline-5-carboxylate reductase
MNERPVRGQLAIIGAGRMAEALIAGLVSSKTWEPASLWATDASAERRDLVKRLFGIQVGPDNREAASWAEIVLIAVKPQVLDAVLAEIAPVLTGRLVISIAAGVTIQHISSHLDTSPARPSRIVRVMPNAPALVCAGMSALAFGPGVTDEDSRVARTLFEAVGRVVTVEESLLDAVTGLSGSGPAYVFMAIEALADGGVKAGLSRSVADLLAVQTVLGAARMVIETGEHPARLKDRVASPGGTTIAGLQQLEQGGLRASLIAAVEAATKRSKELGG